MYTDTFFNLSQMTSNQDPDQAAQTAAEILTRYSIHKPLMALDTGTTAGDIWHRSDLYEKILDCIEDDDEKSAVKNMLYFSAGIMSDNDSIEDRFAQVESLEENIKDFKNSDSPFADRLIAIGPCGVDHDWDSVEYEGRDHTFFDQQQIEDERDLFALQLTLGKKLNLPVIVHSRKSFQDTQDVLKAVKWNKGVIHGYAYTKSEIDFFLDLGWYISFNGTVTYSGKKKFSDMSEVVAYVPKNRLLLETDSPYYAPIPLKNVDNEPSNINYIYEYVAAKRNISIHKLCDIVDENCTTLFGL